MKFLNKPTILRDFLIFALAIFFIVCVITILIAQDFYNNQKNDVETRLEQQSILLERTFLSDLEYIKNQMDILGNQIQNNTLGEKRSTYNLLNIFQPHINSESLVAWNSFDWSDNNLFLVVDSIKGILQNPRDLSNRDYLINAKKHPWQLSIGSPVFGAVLGNWILPTGMGITDNDNNYLGAVIFGFDIEKYAKKISSITEVEGMSYAIFDNNFNLIMESADNRFVTLQNGIFYEIKPENFKKTEGLLIAKRPFYKGGNGFSYYRKLRNYPYIIVVSYDIVETYAQTWGNLYSKGFELFTILFILTGVVFLLHKRIVQPITQLSLAAEKIASGQDNVKVPRKGPYEIFILSKQLTKVQNYVAQIKLYDQDLIKAKNAAESANNAKSDFLSHMSHELRTPLNAILGYSEIMANQLFGPIKNSKYLEYAGDIYKSGSHLLRLINDILDLSKAEQKIFEINEERMDITKTIQECVKTLEKSAETREISLEFTIQKVKIPLFYGDPTRIKQVILNILSNAIKFSSDGSKVKIRLFLEKNKFNIIIEDSGIGIRKSDIPKVLEKFGQINTAMKRKSEGSGIGLWLSNVFVKAHNGRLKIDSTLGKGTKVTIIFPSKRTILEK